MKKLTFTFFLLLFWNSVFSQTKCGLPAEDLPGCVMCAPVITGSNAGYAPNVSSACGVPHNDAVVAVITEGTTLSVNLSISNCITGDGLEMTLFDKNGNEISCGGFTFPANSINASGLTPGELYSIVIDGFSGDVCDFTLVVSGGQFGFAPPVLGNITAQPNTANLCAGAEISYSVLPNSEVVDLNYSKI